MSTTEHRATFTQLHREGFFVMPNPWDAASAQAMVSGGAKAVATTSSGFAATLGRADYEVTVEELLRHSALLAATAQVPLSVDSERCYGSDAAGVAVTVEAIADTGASGCSIEDYDPATDSIDPIEVSIERVAAAAEVTKRAGMVLTARAERHLYEDDADLDDTVERLRRFAEAGADCIYAPGLKKAADIAAVCAIGAPVNVLLMPGTPQLPELAALGVRRVSTGGALLKSAMRKLEQTVADLHDHR